MKPLFSLAVALVLMSRLASAGEIKIVAAENFYGGVAREIAGDSAVITSILSNPNQDPHEFTTSAETAKAVADADIVIYNGVSYDPWMEKLLGTHGKKERTVICVAKIVGAKEGDNPHLWYSPSRMALLATHLSMWLMAKDVVHASEYGKRADQFGQSLKPLNDRIASLAKAYPDVTVTATEPVFGYMAQALGFKMLNYDFQIAIMNDTEPTAAQTAAFEKCLRSKTAKILFYNSQVTDPTTSRLQEIATKAGVPIVGVTETQPPDQKSYVAWMMHELDGVQAALDAKSP